MDMDLELILVIATAVSGIIWLAYWFLTRHKPDDEKPVRGEEPILVDYAKSFFPVLLAVLILRSFVAEPFRIPSGSMLPTLEIGDFILVSKFSYGVRLPVAHTKILDVGEPEVGDVVVFRFPNDPRIDYIKRLVAKPGDKVTWSNKMLSINDVPLQHTVMGPHVSIDQHGQEQDSLLLKEVLNEKEHDILIFPNTPGRSGEMVVPEGHYFVMGDNRDRSNDSRIWGLVPEENLVGKAMAVWLHWHIGHGWPTFGRAGGIN